MLAGIQRQRVGYGPECAPRIAHRRIESGTIAIGCAVPGPAAVQHLVRLAADARREWVCGLS